MSNSQISWFRETIEAVFSHLQSSDGGLSASEAQKRLEQYGPNELQAGQQVSAWSILFEQFKNILIVILLLATGLSIVMGHGVEAVAIAVIVLFAVILGFVQEYRAERAIEALREMAAPMANVLRNGEEIKIPAREVVPGDVIFLRAGDKIPADSRLIETFNLRADEAALTGESLPVEKNPAALDNPALAIGDRRNMVYSGTAISYGRGRAIVTATGMQTEFGKIATLLSTVERGKTPLQENLDKVGHVLARAALVVVLIIVALGVARGQPILEMIIFGIALAVAVVPEALPAVVTISLAIGVQRMVKRNALIRRLPAVETLGSVSVIGSDKTGTLTKDEMTIRKVYVAGQIFDVSGAGYAPEGKIAQNGEEIQPGPDFQALAQAGVLASDASLAFDEAQKWHIKGDPTEGALVVLAAKIGLEKAGLDAQFPRKDEIPFTSETKRMTTLVETKDGLKAFSKGAAEIILESCTHILNAESKVALDDAGREKVLTAAREMAKQALRVIGLAYKPGAARETAEQGMIFLGFVGMIDPPRPEVKSAIELCEKAGIKTVMITGDHPLTAEAIARELGILKAGRVVTGADVDAMGQEAFEREVENIDVYARVSPTHKLQVVTAFQKLGYSVAMTGDGVNDAPALKKADIGIAMGITGTDVTKEAASMTLTDDNFASIVAAVEEGRGVFGNIKKYLMYLLSSNIGEIGLMAGASLFGFPLPLSAVQILYVNLATDGLPALALAVDPPEEDIMNRPPRSSHTGIFTRPVVLLMLVGGIWSTVINLGLFTWILNSGRPLAEAMTMTFISLVLIQFFKAYNYRSDRNSITNKPFINKWLNIAIVWELVLIVLIVYVPFLQNVFGTFPLSLNDWMLVGLLSVSIVPVIELAKWVQRRGWFGALD